MSNKLFVFYVLCLHVGLAIAIAKPAYVEQVISRLYPIDNEISQHYKTMVAFHQRVDKNVLPNSVIFIGDSHTQGLAVSSIAHNAVNYGIGGDTTIGVIERLPFYSSILRSEAIVLAIGFNDLKRRTNKDIVENIQKILSGLPSNATIVLCAVHPVGKQLASIFNPRIKSLNQSLANLSQNYPHVSFLDTFNTLDTNTGFLSSEYHVNDHVHLSQQGYERWMLAIKAKLRQNS